AKLRRGRRSTPKGLKLARCFLAAFTLITSTASCLRQLPSCFAVYPRDFLNARVLCRSSHSLHSRAGSPTRNSNSNEGLPGIRRFSVFYGDVRSNRDANRGRFFLCENVNASVEGERTLAVGIVRQPHFLQTFPGESNLAIRRRALGSIFDDVTLRAIAKKIVGFAKKVPDLDSYDFVFQFRLLLFDLRKGVDLVTDRWR